MIYFFNNSPHASFDFALRQHSLFDIKVKVKSTVKILHVAIMWRIKGKLLKIALLVLNPTASCCLKLCCRGDDKTQMLLSDISPIRNHGRVYLFRVFVSVLEYSMSPDLLLYMHI